MKTAILAVSLMLGAGVGIAHAAPTIAKPDVEDSVIAKVACAWINGVRRCDRRRYRSPPSNGYRESYSAYGAYPNNLRPEAYPTGSTNWWRAMDRECRGGFSCR